MKRGVPEDIARCEARSAANCAAWSYYQDDDGGDDEPGTPWLP